MDRTHGLRYPPLRAFRHRDFRVLWLGAFISFTGAMVQTVAQGYLVYELTGDKGLLALVTFCSMGPVFFIGPLLGTLADLFDRKWVLLLSTLVYSVGAAFLGYATATGFIAFWHVLVVATVSGVVQTIEIPARQSILRDVVPEADVAAAVPMQAMTFNLARLIGPLIGGVLLAKFGPAVGFFVNAVAFSGLGIAAMALSANLRPLGPREGAIFALMTEGMVYTLSNRRLRVLFILEVATSAFSLFYIALMPAFVKDILGLGEAGLGAAYAWIGSGALIGLAALMVLSERPIKILVIRLSMTACGFGLLLLAFAQQAWVAFPIFALLGASVIAQFNTTNTLFQLLAPERLRGRVLSMHHWAIGGLSSFGTLGAGFVAERVGFSPVMAVAGTAILCFAAWGWWAGKDLEDGDAGAA